jgi:hypothetical protein
MTPSQIIQSDAQKAGYDANLALSKLKAQVESGQAIMLRENDSILVLTKIGDGIAELHLFTADKPLTLAKSALRFLEKVRQSDTQRVYGKADNDQIVQLLRNLGMEVQESDRPEYNWMLDL